MTEITFQNILPQVFAAAAPSGGVGGGRDVWQQTLTFTRGRRYLLEADSGRGKSTFCSYIMGYRHDYTGLLLFDGTDARSLSIRQWTDVRQRHISCLFQELRLFPELTAMENVEIKNKLTRHKSAQQLSEWFDRLGLADKRDVLVGRLSFGQQQRVALMRALTQPFDFLLADEPISHLDDQNAALMAALITEEADAQGAAIIATSIGKRLPIDYHHTLTL